MEEIVGVDIFVDDTGRDPYLSFRSTLVVDDSSSTRMIIFKMLRALDLPQVFEAASAADAFALMHNTRVDLVIADINMPDVDGLKLLAAIRGKPALAGATVLLMTASRQTNLVAEALAAGADGYLLKPFSSEQLRSTLNRAAVRRAARAAG
jgi:two-component system chemotaxis response regulator CheY